MAKPKIQQFSIDERMVAHYSRVLAHPARIRIIKLLYEKGECCCGDFVDSLGLAQGTVSQHLRALREGGLINGEISGPRSSYCLNLSAFEKLRTTTATWLDSMESLHSNGTSREGVRI